MRPDLIGSEVHPDVFAYFATPTPGGPNQNPVSGMVHPVTASVTRGFYTGPITVSLTTPTPGAQIRYTLDGSEPAADHGQIYANSYQQGADWERPASVELINPDGSAGFRIGAGLRIRGGYSRSGGNLKHAFRLFFRGEYGASALDFPLFGAEGTDSFAKVDLRTAQHYSWSFDGSPDNNFVAEVFSRDTMRDMGEPYTRSRFYQLYIDGQYWGLYQTEERPDANDAASSFGGDKDDYDVIKVEAGPYTTQATDGNFDAWNRLWQGVTDADARLSDNANYFKLLGENPDGTPNPAYEVLVDPGELADYMITILYGGNLDAPISWFLGNDAPNNFFAIRDRTGRRGLQFLIHDAEHTLLNADQGDGQGVYEDRKGPFPAGQDLPDLNPQFLHQQLMANPEYRRLFADHVQKAFFNGGVLTPDAANARFPERAGEIALAIDGESARRGDAKHQPGYTVADWQAAVDYVADDYMPIRSGIVLAQFRAVDLLPTLAAPIFQNGGSPVHGGQVQAVALLSFAAPGAIVYYTLDGPDPRLIGGGISPGAIAYDPSEDAPIALSETEAVTARAYQASTWTALDLKATVGVLANDTDVDHDPLSAVLDQGPSHGKLTLRPDGSFDYAPAANYHGPDTFTYHPSDGTLDGPTTTVSLTVTSVNDPPSLAAITDVTLDEGATVTAVVEATDPDLPEDTPTFSLDPGAPIGATIDPTTGVFTFSPDETMGGHAYPITVRVTDAGSPKLSAIRTFFATVNELNSPPVIAPIADVVMNENTRMNFLVPAGDPDSPADVLTYRLDSDATSGAILGATTGVFSWAPIGSQGPGVYTFTVTVTDDGTPRLSASRQFRVTVNEVASPPRLLPIADRTIEEDTTSRIFAVARDFDLPAQ